MATHSTMSGPATRTVNPLLLPLAIGALVALTLGVYGRVHNPTGIAVSIAGFSSPQTVKVWLGTGAILFAIAVRSAR